MARPIRYQGLLPSIKNPDGSHAEITPDNIREMRAYIDVRRPTAGLYDIVVEAPHTPIASRPDSGQQAAALAAAGATWWLEGVWGRDRNRLPARDPGAAS